MQIGERANKWSHEDAAQHIREINGKRFMFTRDVGSRGTVVVVSYLPAFGPSVRIKIVRF